MLRHFELALISETQRVKLSCDELPSNTIKKVESGYFLSVSLRMSSLFQSEFYGSWNLVTFCRHVYELHEKYTCARDSMWVYCRLSQQYLR